MRILTTTYTVGLHIQHVLSAHWFIQRSLIFSREAYIQIRYGKVVAFFFPKKEGLLSIGSVWWHPKNSCKMKKKYISNFIAHILRLVWYLYLVMEVLLIILMFPNMVLLPSLKAWFYPLPLLLVSLNAASYAVKFTPCTTVQRSEIIASFICRDRRKIWIIFVQKNQKYFRKSTPRH